VAETTLDGETLRILEAQAEPAAIQPSKDDKVIILVRSSPARWTSCAYDASRVSCA